MKSKAGVIFIILFALVSSIDADASTTNTGNFEIISGASK